MKLFELFKKNKSKDEDNNFNLSPFRRINEKDISDLEKNLGIILPEDYKQFLLKSNGGICSNDEQREIYIKELDDIMTISHFYGIHTREKCYDIELVMNEWRKELPKSTIIIGEDLIEGYFVLICEGSDRGVYYWYMDEDLDMPKYKGKLYKLSNSFTEFLNNI